MKQPIESLPVGEGFWSAVNDILYQTERKGHWNVSLAHSDSKALAEWLSEILPLRNMAQVDE